MSKDEIIEDEEEDSFDVIDESKLPNGTAKISSTDGNQKIFLVPQEKNHPDNNILVIQDDKKGQTIQLHSREPLSKIINHAWTIQTNWFATPEERRKIIGVD